MPNELDYTVKGAEMGCTQGSTLGKFTPTTNTKIKMSSCLVATEADKIPMVNIPTFGNCTCMNGSSCVPAPINWQDTYKVKVIGLETILFKSTLPCSMGGIIEFHTSGQIAELPPPMDDVEK